MSNIIRVFCACAPDGHDAESQMVLEHSIRSRTKASVKITWMRMSRDPDSLWYCDRDQGWNSGNWATPFSWFRYGIPYACDYEGRAIYTDSDVVFLADIRELWEMDLAAGKVVMAKARNRLCVSLWDCAAAKRWLPEFHVLRRTGAGEKWKQASAGLVQFYPRDQNWNCLDGEGLPLTEKAVKAIHFTNIAMQPQLPLAMARLAKEGRQHWATEANPIPHERPDLKAMFDREYEAALASGYVAEDYYQDPPYGEIRKRDLTGYKGLPRKTI